MIEQQRTGNAADVDTKILKQNIIEERWLLRGSVSGRQIWRHFVDLNRPVFKNQPRNSKLKFHCMILTDGVDVSVLKSRPHSPQLQVAASAEADQLELQYTHRLNRDDQAQIQNNCVVVDLGRRNMHFFVHEGSDAIKPNRFRYTKQNQGKDEKKRKFKRIRQQLKTREVRERESGDW